MSILEGELAQTITDALLDADIPYAVTINRTVPGGPGENPWDPPTDDETVVYQCMGFTETFEADYIAGGLVQANDVKVVILVPTLMVTPLLTDTVTVRGQTYTIISIRPDPALATVALQARA